jgi:hypothetical protein
VARTAGDLYPLTIAAIFLVVFTAMWGAAQHSQGELLPAERIDAGEQQVRERLWTHLAEWRTAQGLDPPRRVSGITGAAQRVAATVAAGNRSANTTDGTGPPELGPHPTGSDRCSQLLVAHTVDRPGWPSDTTDRMDATVADAVAEDLLAALVAADDRGLLGRSGEFRTGVGVAARGDAVYVVYRSCARRRLP